MRTRYTPSWLARMLAGALMSEVFLCATPVALAEPLDVWTLRSSTRFALEHAPKIVSARAAHEVALAFRTFGTMPRVGNPVVNVRAMIGRPDDSAATYALALGLPFDVAGTRRRYQAEARHVIEAAQARLSGVRNEVRSEAQNAYVHVVLSKQAHEIADESVATARELYEAVRTRLEHGAATAVDLALSEADFAEASAASVGAARIEIGAQHHFRQMLGLPAHATIAVEPLEAPSLPAISPGQALAIALKQRSEPRMLLSEQKRHEAADNRLAAQAVAPLTANLEAERQGNRQRRARSARA